MLVNMNLLMPARPILSMHIVIMFDMEAMGHYYYEKFVTVYVF